jgi:8-oxo-dGTP pyrophosphatase MutT (NUDIX family)
LWSRWSRVRIPSATPRSAGRTWFQRIAERAYFYFRDDAAPEPNRPRGLGVLALIERDGSLLLERRTDAPLWSLIAGAVEDTESLTDALRREVREETGLIVSRYALFGTFSDPSRIASYPDGNVIRVASFAYLVEVESFERLRPSAESEELRFFARDELSGLDLPATQVPVIERFLADDPPPHLD